MSGVEVAGIAVSFVSAFEGAFKVYAALLGDNSRSDDFNITRIKLLTERARFESWIQQVSKYPQSMPDPMQEVMEQAVDQINREFAKIDPIAADIMDSKVPFNKRPLNRRVKWELVQSDRFSHIVRNLQTLNDSLWTLLNQLPPSQGCSESQQAEEAAHSRPFIRIDTVESREDSAPKLLSSEDEVAESPKEMEIPEPRPVFRLLVNACQSALQLLGSTEKQLGEVWFSYRLWTHALVTENIYSIFTEVPLASSETQEPSIILVQYRALMHLTWTLLQTASAFEAPLLPTWPEASTKLHTALNEAHDAGLQEEYIDFADFPELKQDANKTREFAIKESRLLVSTLLDLLPSTLHFTRERLLLYEATSTPTEVSTFDDNRTEAIGQLLDISVRLMEPASLALAKITEEESKPGSSSTLKESIKTVFDKQASALQFWKEKYGPKIEGRLTSRNPAKWESIAESVFNIALILKNIPAIAKFSFRQEAELSAHAEKLLNEYSTMYPHLGLDATAIPQDITTAVELLKTCVQALVALEIPIELVDPPPPYEGEANSSVVLLDIEGRMVESY